MRSIGVGGEVHGTLVEKHWLTMRRPRYEFHRPRLVPGRHDTKVEPSIAAQQHSCY